MKQTVFVALLIVIMLPIVVLPLLSKEDVEVAGRLNIPAHDIHAVIMTAHGVSCGCCPSLWNGGIAHALEDLSPVQVGDMATLTTLDGGYRVMECLSITDALHIGRRLISWRGIVKADGDVIVFSAGRAYRFTIL